MSISLSGLIALGTIGFSYLKGYRGNLLSILFGYILAISNTDLILLLLLLAVTLAWIIISLIDNYVQLEIIFIPPNE